MTRINLVDPKQLTYKHLLAEYKELPRVFTHILKAHKAGKTIDDYKLPERYTIGKGHVTFFYNKAHYLWWRWENICLTLEMERGTKLTKSVVDKVERDYINLPLWARWATYEPTPEEIYLNMYRLSNRLFFGEDMDVNDQQVLEKMKEPL